MRGMRCWVLSVRRAWVLAPMLSCVLGCSHEVTPDGAATSSGTQTAASGATMTMTNVMVGQAGQPASAGESAGAPSAPVSTGAAGSGAPVAGSQAGGGGAPSGAAGAATAGGAGASSGAAGLSGSAGASGSTGAAGNNQGMSASQTEIWVAQNGDDTNPGTQDMPLAGLAAAVAKASAGMTIWVGPGTYQVRDTIVLDARNSEDKPIQIFAAPGAERPVFDFSAQTPGDSKARGFEISGDYFHLRGFDVTKAGDNCIHIAGGHNTVERVVIHECGDTGLQISANGSEAGDKTRAANNLILNCDSYANYDKQNQGENADGFAAKLYIGPGNVFRGCRAWNNADDGWDLFASDDVVVIEDCWAIANGKIGPGQNNTNGDGNGFKLGGAAKAGDANMGGAPHEVRRCFSIGNAACGFTRNNNTQLPQLSMCGGRGDGKGMLCKLSIAGEVPISMSPADAIAAQRDKDGNLPPIH